VGKTTDKIFVFSVRSFFLCVLCGKIGFWGVGLAESR